MVFHSKGVQMFSREFCKNFKNTVLSKQLRTTASGHKYNTRYLTIVRGMLFVLYRGLEDRTLQEFTDINMLSNGYLTE